jgi:hypothetical protein
MKTSTKKGTKWLERIGFAGFVFFLAKGLVWLVLLSIAWFKLKS